MRIEQTGPADCRIWDGEELVAEIRSLRLKFFRTRKGGDPIIGPVVPLPLYWQQYADHEHPERNLSSGAALAPGPSDEDSAVILCTGSTASGVARSSFRLEFSSAETGYAMHVAAELTVPGASGWTVTPNPHHGELEFCTLWPVGSFLPSDPAKKRYRMCAVRRSGEVLQILHHHLESPDKHNILMREGDEAAWLMEEENPSVRIDSSPEVSAGVCAYMWDMHFAYRVCRATDPVVLPHGFRAEARYTIRSITRNAAELWLRMAAPVRPKGLDAVPLFVQGLHTFRETFATADLHRTDLWPWAFETIGTDPGSVRGEIDRRTGYDDNASLVIRGEPAGSGRWVATTIGPAFGGPPFMPGRRYRLTARVRRAGGKAGIGLALHREGVPGLYDPSTYEEYTAEAPPAGDTGWALCIIVTPAIDPPPDRVHLRLVHEGDGASWFDNVLFEEFD